MARIEPPQQAVDLPRIKQGGAGTVVIKSVIKGFGDFDSVQEESPWFPFNMLLGVTW
jgi:hypothetical protein